MVGPTPRISCEGRTTLGLVHDDRADDDAATRLQPPLVSCIRLLDRCFASALYRSGPVRRRMLWTRIAEGAPPVGPTTARLGDFVQLMLDGK